MVVMVIRDIPNQRWFEDGYCRANVFIKEYLETYTE